MSEVLVMAISDDKIRVQVTMTKDFKKKCEEVAKEENRNLSNLILHALTKYIEKK